MLSQQTRHMDTMLNQCYATICDAGPTQIQQCIHVSCFLGSGCRQCLHLPLLQHCLHLPPPLHCSSLSTVDVNGGGPKAVVSTAVVHARFRGSVTGLGGLKETKIVSSPSTCESQYCGEPPRPRGSVLGLRPPGIEF